MEIQAIANITDSDLAQTISELPAYEISDLFLQVIEKLNNPESIKMIAERLLKHSKMRFGI